MPKNYGRPGREELALAVIHFLSPVPVAGDLWNSGDHWRLNGAMTRPLTLTTRDGVMALRATYINGAYEIENDGERFTAALEHRSANGLTISVNGTCVSALLTGDARAVAIFHKGRVVRLALPVASADGNDHTGGGRITAPMPGRIVSVLVGQGDNVAKDQPLLIMEAMKMEMTIRATLAGEIEELPVAMNDQVPDGALLVSIKTKDAA
jgi:3-methylcrotonyl-CoA carboxylase alpha subunit